MHDWRRFCQSGPEDDDDEDDERFDVRGLWRHRENVVRYNRRKERDVDATRSKAIAVASRKHQTTSSRVAQVETEEEKGGNTTYLTKTRNLRSFQNTHLTS